MGEQDFRITLNKWECTVRRRHRWYGASIYTHNPSKTAEKVTRTVVCEFQWPHFLVSVRVFCCVTNWSFIITDNDELNQCILSTFLFYRRYGCWYSWECRNLLNSLYIGRVSSWSRCVKSSYICLYNTWVLARLISTYFIYFSCLSLVYMLLLMRMQKSFKFTVYWYCIIMEYIMTSI